MGIEDEIRNNRAKRRRAVARIEQIDTELAELIKQALAADLGATQIARIAGLSRERVYQIRDGRR